LDFEGRIRGANPACTRLLGHAIHSFVDQPYLDFIHPEDRLRAQLDVEGGPPPATQIGVRTRGADGEYRWTVWLILPWPSRRRLLAVGGDFTSLQRARRQLARLKEIADDVVNATSDAIWDVDLITGRITGNPQLYAFLGHGPDEVQLEYGNWLQYVHPDDRERVAQAFEEHLWGDAPMYHLEHRLLRADGTERWVLARGRVVSRQLGDQPQRLVGSYTDVTARHEAELALQRSEERARIILDSVTIALVIVRLSDGQACFANDHARDLFGDAVDGDFDFLSATTDRARLLDELDQFGHVNGFELPFNHPEGDVLWLMTSGTLIEFDGKPAMLATFADISARRQAERAVLDRNATLDLLLSTTNDGVWDWNLATDRVRYSPRWAEMLGYRPADLPDRADTWRRLILPPDRPLAEYRIRAHLERDLPLEYTARFLHRDGSVRWMVVRGQATRDDAGRPQRVFGVHTDITEQMHARDARQRMEARLQKAQRGDSLQIMAKGVAHDFNNLLLAIIGNSELALLDVPGDNETAVALGEIAAAARRAGELCSQLISYAGEDAIQLGSVDVSRLIREMSALLEASTSRKAEIVLPDDHALPPVEADPTRLRQVVMSIVLNASDAFGTHPGRITIRTGVLDAATPPEPFDLCTDELPPGRFVHIDVIDDGCGIDREHLPRVFDPFFTTKGGHGRGLGLAASVGIVRRHGGALKIRSILGQGTCVRLLLPAPDTGLAAAARPRRAVESDPVLFRGDGRVLFVDDEEAIRDMARKVLERAGFDVRLATHGEEAVACFQHEGDQVRLVLLDLTMPRLDGIEVFHLLRAMRADVPIVLMSGFPEHAATRTVTDEPCVEFLPKPFTRTELLGRIDRLLNGQG
ncbi:MAG: PAS domain-containing protein, partial [Myxococcales bacterium]|nr:PAS domain-containing protein [Myxococcales bacterium]